MPRPAKVTVSCAVCKTEFQVKPSRARLHKNITCSKPCLSEHLRRSRIKYCGSEETRIGTCSTCGEKFERKTSQLAKYKDSYCNRECRAIGIRGKPNLAITTGRFIPCKACGKEVWRTPATEQPNTYCSYRCSANAPRTLRVERVVKQCLNCQKTMRMLPFEAKKYRFCSMKCAAQVTQGAKRGLPGNQWTPQQRAKLSKTLLRKYQNEWAGERRDRQSQRMTGELNPAWLGGRRLLPYSPGFTRRLKYRIARRDQFRCRLCGVRRGHGTHVVHHIDWGKDNHSEDNLVYLCRPCHGRVHGGKIQLRSLRDLPGPGSCATGRHNFRAGKRRVPARKGQMALF
jgi:hypothetical protein